MSVVSPVTTEQPIDRFASNFDKETWQNVVLSLVRNPKLDYYENLSFQTDPGYFIIFVQYVKTPPFYYLPFFYNIFTIYFCKMLNSKTNRELICSTDWYSTDNMIQQYYSFILF